MFYGKGGQWSVWRYLRHSSDVNCRVTRECASRNSSLRSRGMRRTIPSSDPVARYFPSRLKTTDSTPLEWVKLKTSWPEAASHTFAVRSQLAVARYFPSGLKT